MQFETKVTAAAYDERARRRWNVGTSRGEQISTKYGILATGLTSAMAACYFWPTAGMWARTFLANRERCWPYLGGLTNYRRQCEQGEARGYANFALSA